MSKSSKNHPILLLQCIKCSSVSLLNTLLITLLKWMKYKNKLAFAYYSITFGDFKSSTCSKNLTNVKNKKRIFWKISKYWHSAFYDLKNGVKRPYKKKNYSREKKISQQMSFSEIFLLSKITAPIFQIIYIRNKTLNPSVNGGLKQKRKVQTRLQGLWY